jgi:hypothetical protein
MYEDWFLREVSLCAEWIKGRKMGKTYSKYSSYTYKKMVGKLLTRDHIWNGAFIAAAVGLGLDFQVHGRNAFFKFAPDKRGMRQRVKDKLAANDYQLMGNELVCPTDNPGIYGDTRDVDLEELARELGVF